MGEYTDWLQCLANSAHYGYGPAFEDENNPFPAIQGTHNRTRKIDRVRRQEFSRLSQGGAACFDSQNGTVYLDHAGSALYSERQLEYVFEELRTVLLSNPHSVGSSSSKAAFEAEASLRGLTLELCGASGKDYEVVLTAGATAALRLVAEAFPWTPSSSQFAYLDQNHNSVLGMREFAMAAGAEACAVKLQSEEKAATPPSMSPPLAATAAAAAASHAGRHVKLVPCSPRMRRRVCSHPVQQKHITRYIEEQDMQEDAGRRALQGQGEQPGQQLQQPYQQPQQAEPRGNAQVSPQLEQQQAQQQQEQEQHSTSSPTPQQQQGQQQLQHHEQHSASTSVPAILNSSRCTYHLFAMPHECNFSGRRYDLGLVQQVHDQGVDLGPSLCQSSGQHSRFQHQGHHKQQQRPIQHHHQPRGHPPSQQQAHFAQELHASMGAVHAEADRWLVLLDAAKSCATSPPNLSKHPADFVVLSYYKIFGFPTGLGALIVRKPAADLLRQHKQYFGGGAVGVAIADQDFFSRRSGPAGLEDGTLPFTNILAARHGFDFLRHLGSPGCIPACSGRPLSPQRSSESFQHQASLPPFLPPSLPFTQSDKAAGHGAHASLADALAAVSAHCSCLTHWLVQMLRGLRHVNGRPVVVVYGHDGSKGHALSDGPVYAGCQGDPARTPGEHPCSKQGVKLQQQQQQQQDSQDWGPVVSFNLKRADDSWVGCNEVGRLAALHGIILRTGCFCNPGACAKYLGLTGDEMRKNFESGHVCWDDKDTVNGRPTGAVRISLGHVSSFQDVYTAVRFIRHYFVEGGVPQSTTFNPGESTTKTPTPQEVHGVPSDAQAVHTTRAPASASPALSNCDFAAASTKSSATCGRGVNSASSHREAQSHTILYPTPSPATSTPVAPISSITAQIDPPLPAAQVLEPLQGSAVPAGAASTKRSNLPAACNVPHTLSHGASLPAVAPAEPPAPTCCIAHAHSCGKLLGIFLYPIKSCAPQQAEWWPLGPTGLLYDREWALLGDDGSVVTQKQCPKMVLVQPHVDLACKTLTVTAPGMLSALVVSLGGSQPCQQNGWQGSNQAQQQQNGLQEGSLVQHQHQKGEHGMQDAQRGMHPQQPAGLHSGHAMLQPRPQQHGSEEVIQVCGDHVCGSLVAVQVVTSTTSCEGLPASTRLSSAGEHMMVDGMRGGSWPCGTGDAMVNGVGAHTRSNCVREGTRGSEMLTGTRQPPQEDLCGAGAGGEEVARQWFAQAVGVPCRLVQQVAGAREARAGTAGVGPKKSKAAAGVSGNSQQGQQQHSLSHAQAPQSHASNPVSQPQAPQTRAHLGFANDGQFLLVNEASVQDLNARIANAAGSTQGGFMPAAGGSPVELLRFRPNFVVGGFPAYDEDQWSHVQIGRCSCSVLGTCPRCEMLQVNQATGTRGKPEVLLALAQYKRHNGRMHFGILLTADAADADADNAASGSHGTGCVLRGGGGSGCMLPYAACVPYMEREGGSQRSKQAGAVDAAASRADVTTGYMKGYRWFRLGDSVCATRSC